MSDSATTDPYRAFDPRAYLRQYYSTPNLATDDVAIVERLSSWLETIGPLDTAIDIGCGPTVHHAFPLARFAREIHLADYLSANLAEVQLWLDNDLDAHDWDPILRGVLRVEASDLATLESRKAELRRKVTVLRHCDLRRDDALGDGVQYDLVTSFYCVECICSDHTEWESLMSRLLGFVKPNGSVFLAAVRKCERYSVLGRWFDVARVTEVDFFELFAKHGFRTVSVESVRVPDWVGEGFDSICIASATKPN